MIAIRFSGSDDSDSPAGPCTSPVRSPISLHDPEPSDSVFVLSSSDSDFDPKQRVAGPLEFTFRFNVRTLLTIRGRRIHFQLAHDGRPLFHSKLRARQFHSPVGISTGFSSHFSQEAFAGFLYPKNKERKMIVTDGSPERTALMSIAFKNVKGSSPKEIECVLLQTSRSFVSKKATKDGFGHWCLSFGGRLALPSVKNCVLVDADEPNHIALQMRRVSEVDCELDSFGVFDPLLVFGYAMASYANRI
jgi:hypothetical protein